MSLIEKIALKPCRECGCPCRVETFEGENVSAKLWLCSDASLFGGKCPSTDGYISEEAWNNRAALTAIMGAGDGVTQADIEAAREIVGLSADPAFWASDPVAQAFARHRQLAAAVERDRIVAAVERELAMTAMTNAEEASTDWIDGFEHAWKRAKVAIDRGEV